VDNGHAHSGENKRGREKLVVSFGMPPLSGTRCTFDKSSGTVKILRRKLLHVEREVIPLSLVLDMKVRRERTKLVRRYTAVMRVLRGNRIEFPSLSGAQAKKAMRRVLAFLG
jgi:hypothetical protein